MSNFFDKLLGKSVAEETKVATAVDMVCMYDSSERPVVDYSEKFSRADKINYTGVGMTRYASGLPPAYYNEAIAAIYSSPVVYGCVSAISDAVASLGVKVYQVTNGQKVEVYDHPFYQLFNQPNPYQGSHEFLEELQQTLDVMGNAFVAIEHVAGAVELYILSAKYVSIIPDPKKKIKEYHFYINGNLIKYKPEEIIHVKLSDIDDPYYGMPPLKAALGVLTVETARQAYVNNFFTNGAIPQGVLETDSNLGESLLKKLRSEWYKIHRGISNSHNIAILQGGLKYKTLATPIKDMDFAGLRKLTREDILTIFRVPESILGSQEGTGSTEGKAALTAFYRGCIIPRLKRIESSLNRGLAVDMFGMGEFVFEFNMKDVAALQEDKVEQANYLTQLVSSSVMTINEARAIYGLPASTDQYADELVISNSYFGNALMPVDAARAGAGGAGTTDTKPAVKPNVAPNPTAPKPAAKPVAKPKLKPKK